MFGDLLVEIVDDDLLTPARVAELIGAPIDDVLREAAWVSTNVVYDDHRCMPMLNPEQALEIRDRLGLRPRRSR